MTTAKQLQKLAIMCIEKNMDYETFKYSDYCYGTDINVDEVWAYVTEIKNYGLIAFRKKYEL